MCPGVLNGGPNGIDDHIRYISLDFDGDECEASALQLVTQLRPDWKSPDSRIEFKRFTEGITNTLLKAVNKRDGLSKEEVDDDAILLRAYGNGTQVLIDRQRETQNHELLMKYHLAPALLARFNNGMMYRFLKGRAAAPEDLRQAPIYLAVARRIAQWHATVPCVPSPRAERHQVGVNGSGATTNGSGEDSVAPGKPPPNLWTVMHKWLLALPTGTEAERERQATLQAELASLIENLSQRPGLGQNGLVFAHCDLLSGNVIVQPKAVTSGPPSNEETVSFIDYEYATPSPAAFDLANHFAEWGGFDCDFSVLPTRAQRQEFIREYIRTYFSLLPESQRPEDAGSSLDEEAQAAKLFAEVDTFRGVPGFYWGIWALIQATISDIDFDYASYAEIRLGEYWAWKAEVSGSRAAEGKELPLREKRWAQAE
ncbi:choline/ethanolamine kinase [Xylariales sp. PMI_506]|nr:choline/ethanolamine kinase [Xylariales sp. PMI_506]